jgi:hypothetical protein
VLAPFDAIYDALPEPVQRFYRRIAATPQFDLRRAARFAGAGQNEVESMVDLLMDLNLVAEPAPGRFVLLPVVREHAHSLLLTTESKASKAELVA